MFLSYLRNESLARVRRYPSIFFPLIRFYKWFKRGTVEHLVSKETDLVIEGYFRSGNTFAAYAFQYSQPEKVSLAYHTHAAATVIQAVRWNIPALVLIRQPVDTVTSLVLKNPTITISQGFKEYIDYYQRIEPYSRNFTVSSFEEVIANFGHVIQKVNRHFGTNFNLFMHSDENVKKIFMKIERIDRKLSNGDVGKLSIPLSEKENLKLVTRSEIEKVKYCELVRQSENIFDSYIARRNGHFKKSVL